MQKKYIITGFALIAMTVLIFDSKTGFQGAQDGVMLCIQTVIPSLFPFFFLSGLINQSLSGYSGQALRPIGRLCGIPAGAEPILLLGLTGGYPVGAQAIGVAFENGQISKADAQRMLGFCSTAGPAFVFGIAADVFENKLAPWVLWAILILSSLLTGIILPGKSNQKCQLSARNQSKPLEQALKAMSAVCGWVILFRVLICFLNRWVLWMLPTNISAILTGLLELTNGCVEIIQHAKPAFCFVTVAGMMAFGGVCVGLQTVSVAGKLNCTSYFKGKLLQAVFAVILALIFSAFLFPGKR